jgi:hypothetical protein
LQSRVTDFLHSSHTCLLLVSLKVQRLEDAVDELLLAHDWPRLSVGQELGTALLPEMPRNRPRAADRWTKARLGEMAPGPVLCTEIDLHSSWTP